MAANQLATAQNLIDRFDTRVVGDMVLDTNAQAPKADLLDNGTEAGKRVEIAIEDATADIESAVLSSGVYSPAQLTEAFTDGNATLIRTTCSLAMGYLYDRRGVGVPDNHQTLIDSARDAISSFKRGEDVLNIESARGAQTIRAVEITSGPMAASPLFPDQNDASQFAPRRIF